MVIKPDPNPKNPLIKPVKTITKTIQEEMTSVESEVDFPLNCFNTFGGNPVRPVIKKRINNSFFIINSKDYFNASSL